MTRPRETAEVPLAGGNMGPVVRRGNEVLRIAGPWTPSVHRLMRHCRDRGLTEIPAPRGLEDGREVLDFVPGIVPVYPLPRWVWSPAVLEDSARLLRRFHDATADADRTGPWRSAAREPAEVICHGDMAPHNLVFAPQDEHPIVGLIDLDFAAPGPRVWDLAHLAYRVVPLTTDRADGFTDAERLARTKALVAAYDEHLPVPEVMTAVAERVEDLAAFSRRMADELGRADLHEHAALYDADADYVRALAR